MSEPAFRFLDFDSATRGTRGLPTGAHFYGQALHLLCRLRDHIERLDSGVVYAADDIAVALRALLAPGKGNGILLHLHQQYGRSPLEVQLSRPPATDDVLFSVGSIPVPWIRAQREGASWTKLSRWPKTPVVRVRVGNKTTTFAWQRLIASYANSWGGAHLDGAVSKELQVIDEFEAGGLPLSAYLLRSAAVQAWLIGQALLVDAITVRGGQQLSASEVSSTRLAAPGGISGDPHCIRDRGELQWLSCSSTRMSMLAYVEPTRAAQFQVSTGQMQWDVTCRPQNQTAAEPAPTFRAREPIPRAISASDFSEGKAIEFTARFLPFETSPSKSPR